MCAIIPVSFSICEVCLIAIRLFDCYLVVRSWSVTLQFDFKGFMAQKGKSISNADAYDKYIKRFKSDWEASGHFISDESLLSEKDQSSKLKKHWSNRMIRMALLRRKWNKLNRKKRSEKTIETFLSHQQEVFYNLSTIVEDDITMSSASSPEQNVEGGSTVEENEEVHMRTVPLSPLDELSQRHARRRTDAILTQLKEEAEKQMITVTQLLGYLLYRVNYTHDKAVAEVGKKLFDQESVDREVTLDEALHMLSTYRLGRSAYTSLRHYLMQKVDLPAHYKLMQHKNMIMPSASSPIGVSGVSVNLCESVRIHFQRLIGILGLQPGTYRMSAKEGLDGSGRHAIKKEMLRLTT